MFLQDKQGGPGIFLIGLGVFYGSVSMRTLALRTGTEMGPGLFPLILSGLLCLIGTALCVRGAVERSETPLGEIPWRPIVVITSAILAFAFLLNPLGLFPARFLVTLI